MLKGNWCGIKISKIWRMSNMKFITQSERLAFENLCSEILKANKWDVQFHEFGPNASIDLMAINLNTNEEVAFEVKHSRNNTYPISQLTIAAGQLLFAAQEAKADRAVLLVANDIKPEIKQRIEKKFDIQIMDLDDLLSMASVDLQLLDRFAKACEIDISERQIKSRPIEEPNKYEVNEASAEYSIQSSDEAIDLREQLKSIPYGRENARDFECTAYKILKNIFGDDLAGWHEQKTNDGGLHRYDLICRVVEVSAFWKFISVNLDSRYVLFEFKNYQDKIGQDEIYSTEKYLYERAKRKVCFLISRHGPSKNAFIACQGAMREHGKLIINLDEEMLIQLLNSKAEGDDPNDILFNEVDRFLMELPR
jgi:hypothetical protein